MVAWWQAVPHQSQSEHSCRCHPILSDSKRAQKARPNRDYAGSLAAIWRESVQICKLRWVLLTNQDERSGFHTKTMWNVSNETDQSMRGTDSGWINDSYANANTKAKWPVNIGYSQLIRHDFVSVRPDCSRLRWWGWWYRSRLESTFGMEIGIFATSNF